MSGSASTVGNNGVVILRRPGASDRVGSVLNYAISATCQPMGANGSVHASNPSLFTNGFDGVVPAVRDARRQQPGRTAASSNNIANR